MYLLTYYGTFGMGHDQQGCIQPIQAKDEAEAHKLMFEKYGSKFAFVYSEKEFNEQLDEGYHIEKEFFSTLKQEVV